MSRLRDGLFRRTALEHYLQGESAAGPLKASPPWTWALFWTMGVGLLATVGLGHFGSVEVTGWARGILLPQRGIQTLNTSVAGTVAAVTAASGQDVKAGQPILNLDSAPLQSQLLEADRQLSLLKSDHQVCLLHQDQYRMEEEVALRSRLTLLGDQEASQRESMEVYARKLKAHQELERVELESRMGVEDAREALAQARRQWLLSRQGVVQARQEMAALKGRWEDELWRKEQELRLAQARREALQVSLAQTQMKASHDGTLESVLVKVGDVLTPGQVVGRIVPKGSPLRVVAFLPEKDRAFVKVGDLARLELDQHSFGEFGTLQAKVVRIATDLASLPEAQEALGEAWKLDGAAYRVELDLVAGGRSGLQLRTGMLVNVRLTLRKQPPFSLLVEPLRRWLG